MSHALQGLFVPVTTPFGDDGEIAPDRLARQIEIYSAYPIAGVVLFGTSGEGLLLDAAEEGPLLATVRGVLPSDWRMIVQVGRESVRATRAAADRAAEVGADALLCLPPRYYALDESVIAEHYRSLHRATALPILAYHIPQRSRVELPVELLVALAREGTLSGIKDSAGDLELQTTLRREAGGDFAVLNGMASTTAAALAGGANGAILAIADVVPERVLALFDAWMAKAEERVDEIQSSLLPLARCCGPRYGVPGIKAGLDAREWPGGGPPRSPMAPLAEADREIVRAALRTAGIEP